MTYDGYGKKIPVKYLLETLKKIDYNVDSLEVVIPKINAMVKKLYK